MLTHRNEETVYLQRIESRFIREEIKDDRFKSRLCSPGDVFSLFRSIGEETAEKFLTLYINSDNKIVCFAITSIGSISKAYISPREIIKSALLSGATAIITLHNHPSGKRKPSADDKAVAKEIKEICDLMGIDYLDNIIIAHDQYYSFFEEGDLNFLGFGNELGACAINQF